MQTIQPKRIGRNERVLRGRDGWWYLGPSGIARLTAAHLTAQGDLTDAAARFLTERGLRKARTCRVYQLTVLTSTDCNLGCGYCFQNTGQDPKGGSRPPRIEHARLTSETIGTALDFTGARMAEGGFEHLSITLFGGEPLLNPRGCRELLARAADYGLVGAGMISNGTLLTPRVAAQLAELGLRDVQITFDGDREQHDAVRVQRSGGGTFDTIVNNIALVSQAAPIRWNLRINLSHDSYLGVDKLLDRLAEQIDPARCSIGLAWVGDLGIGFANDLRHTGDVADLFVQWYRRAMGLGFGVSRPGASEVCWTCFYRDGRYGAVVSADGTLSSCWETAGRPDWQVGTTSEGYLPPAETDSRWVTCVSQYQQTEDSSVRETFRDTLHARLLDELSAAGRL